ncbi:hypothetical protein N752_03025 [Desulforamulus aquiferis]|nr:precorrin-6A reductase [Desulforamulus aquiferis]RYD06660.1 hypothetical protein N752_03025 [Desulforamulus aquiferis]
MILVLAGTQEGRITAELLQQSGFMVKVSTVTGYGAELLKKQGVNNLLTGQLDEQALIRQLRDGIELLVDATHPFAVIGSKTAIAAANEVGIPYLRLERPRESLPQDPLVIYVESLEESLMAAHNLGKKVWFSTLGGKNMRLLYEAAKGFGARLVVRVLPERQSLNTCFELDIKPSEIIALQGPCSLEVNKALYGQYGAEVVLTKDSGSAGGVKEKVQAAIELGIPIIVWQRPKITYPLMVNTPGEVWHMPKRI